jgi:hypothetical protein
MVCTWVCVVALSILTKATKEAIVPNYQRRRRTLGALIIFAFMLTVMRWQGYYGLMPVAPWIWSIAISFIATLVVLRMWVLINRYMW